MVSRTASGQLELPLGPPSFQTRVLRLLLLVGSMSPGPIPLEEAWRFVKEHHPADMTPASWATYRRNWQDFERYARVTAGVSDVHRVDRALVDRFAHALAGSRKPGANTVANRIHAIRFVYSKLRLHGLAGHDPTMDLRVDRRLTRTLPVVSDAEVERCRWAAESALDASPRYVPVWALLESGAATGEIALAQWSDVSPGATTVTLTDKNDIRRALSPTLWAQDALRRCRGQVEWPDIAGSRSTDYHARRTSVAHVVTEIIQRGGVGAPARSITAWAARRVLTESGSIEAAARTIGFNSLDRTAELIAHRWQEPAT